MLNSDSTKAKSKLDNASQRTSKSSTSAESSAAMKTMSNGTTSSTKTSNLESAVDKINTCISSQQKASLQKDKTKALSDSTPKLNASQDVEMEDASSEKALATSRATLKHSADTSAVNDHSDLNNNNNNVISQENSHQSKLVGKLNPESVSIPLTHWSLQGPITTVNLTESTPNGYFLMHAPIDLISASATLSQSSLGNLNGFVGATLNANALAAPPSPPSCSSSINSSPNSTGSGSGTGVKIVRDERRRANHNEVERRRRDNINKWIVELSKVIPDCSNDQSKHGQSKGGILEKTVQYLCLLKDDNQRLKDQVKHLERIQHENALLTQQNESFLKENSLLRAKLNENATSNSNVHRAPTSSSSMLPETSSNGAKDE